MRDTGQLNVLWASLMVEEFVRNGITQFYLSPGSRCTPLTVAIARHPKADAHMHFDERGSAFRAVGYARATGAPAVWVTTSGTAVANGFPAVVEAAMDHLPMICLTADRPPELRDCGANQAIDQVKIFSDYVEWFYDLPCPTEEMEPGFVVRKVHDALSHCTRGPVHLNAMYREPFLPESTTLELPEEVHPAPVWSGNRPVAGISAVSLPDTPWLEKERGIILVGRQPGWDPAIPKLAQALGWPVFPDLLSGLRSGGEGAEGPEFIDSFDRVLLSEAFTERHPPEVVLHLGEGFISKRVLQWMDRCPPESLVHIRPHAGRSDPGHRITHGYTAPVPAACEALIARCTREVPGWNENAWLQVWKEAAERADTAMHEVMGAQELTEPHVASYLAGVGTANAPHHPNWDLFVGSSMPVRDVDMAGELAEDRGVAANRGASGIDGTVASAFGYAEGRKQPVILLLGDLALLHDLNSLALLNDAAYPVIVVVINNDGGGIFSFLPIAGQQDVFESCFGTPHGLTFESAASMFGLPYACPTSVAAFDRAFQDAVKAGASALIEVQTDREQNLRVHRDIQAAVRAALD